MEIIKEVIEIVLAILGVYIGGAIYNWGYRNGLKIQVERIERLEEIVRIQSRKIHELLAVDYCSNPFPILFNDESKEGPSCIGPKQLKAIHEYQSVDKKHLRSKGKKIKCQK